MRVERKLSTQQHRSVKRLIRTECCNHYEGLCLPTDRPCKQLAEKVLRCKWFYESVLPRSKLLCAELQAIPLTPATDTIDTSCTAPELKRCVCCGQEFTPASNRAKYCSACAAVVRRVQKRQHEQERRNRQRANRSA